MTTEVIAPKNALLETTVLPFTALSICLRATLPSLTQKAMPADEQLRAEATRLGLDTSVPTQWIYTGVSGDLTNEFQLEIALPLPANMAVTPDKPFEVKTFPSFYCVQHSYTGRWDTFSSVYDELFNQLYTSGRRYNGQVREVYRVVNLDALDQCETDIQIGLS